MRHKVLILGIETSCDETATALYDSDKGLLTHAIHSQIPLHRKYGGVVPELASRDHIRKILPLIDQVLTEASVSKSDLDAIAYTSGPGLVGALMVGSGVGRSIAYALGIPGIEVHHMEGHLLAPMLEEDQAEFPFVALLVSGGHTQLYAVKNFGEYELIGDTLDDAAGEAFDKTAKLMGLPYPGGPEISKLAELGDKTKYRFPKPMTNRPGLEFSFSGLKTFARNTWIDSDKSEQTKANIAASFEEAATETLKIKCRRALEQTGFGSLVIAGGVSANKTLRAKLHTLNTKLYYPRFELCTDNAAMIAYAGLKKFERGHRADLSINVFARGEIK